MRRYQRDRSLAKRGISILLSFVFMLSAFMSGTFTWFAAANAKNEFSGTRVGGYSVSLNKLEKGADGQVTETPIKDAEFYLYRIIDAETNAVEQIGNNYKTDDKGIVQVKNLVAGEYYFLETDPSYSYDFDKGEDQTTEVRKYPFTISPETVDATNNIEVKAYNRKVLAPLTLTKTVVNRDGTALEPAVLNQDFEFTVTFSDGKSYSYKVNDGETQELIDGKLLLKHGQKAVFEKVPVGIQYTVKETQIENFTAISENHTGNIQLDGNTVEFTNLYGPEKVSNLTISKTVTGVGDQEKYFTFIVTLGEDPEQMFTYEIHGPDGIIGNAAIHSGGEIQLKHGERAVFIKLPVGLSYAVEEKAEEGYTSVTGNQTGQIVELGSHAQFVNDMPKPQVYGDLIVTKTIVGDAAEADKEFFFTAIVGTETYTFTLKGGDKWILETVPVGTQYQIIEADYSADGYVTTSGNANSTVHTGDNIVEYTNTKETIPEERFGKLTVEKHVVGGDPEKEFEFSVQIGDTEAEKFVLKHGETKVFDRIPVGTHYIVMEENYFAEGYFTTSTNTVGTVTEDGVVAAYTNTKQEEPLPQTGALKIHKRVTGAGNLEKDFAFKVVFSDGKDYAYKFDDGKEGISPEEEKNYKLEDGKLLLKHGQSAIFEKLPVGVSYIVTEEAVTDYVQGIVEQKGTIAANITAEANYENYKTPSAKDGELIVKKITTGENADLNKKFDFVVTINGEKTEFSLANGEEKILKLPVGAVYEVEEKDYSSEGYILSSVTKGTGTGDGMKVEVIFTNTFIGEVLIGISGEKTWDVPNEVKLPDSIIIYLKNGEQIVQEKIVTAKEDWKYTFTDIPKYDHKGTEIVYTVDEKPVDGFDKVIDGLNIKNVYVEPVTRITPEVEKKITVEGEGKAKEATFTFALEGKDNAPMPNGSDGQKKILQMNGEGTADFGEITYRTPGTYIYKITEAVGKSEGYSYDTTEYTYTVKVEKDGKALKVSSVLMKAESEEKKAAFTNIYVPQSKETGSLTVNKRWAGTVNPNQPESVEIQLYKNGVAEGTPISLNAENNWVHTWTELDREVSWTIDEVNVPTDYTKVIVENGKNGFTVTNTYTPDNKNNGGSSPGTGDGSSPGVSRPGSGGSSNNSGGVSYPGTSVAGPKTNDPSYMKWWFIAMIASAVGLRYMVFPKRSTNRSKKEKQK